MMESLILSEVARCPYSPYVATVVVVRKVEVKEIKHNEHHCFFIHRRTVWDL